MIHQELHIDGVGENSEAILTTYFMEASPELYGSECRPLILLSPGGAYRFTSDREAEPVALSLNAMGFHVAVLRYTCAPARFPQALLELAESMRLLKKQAQRWNIDKDKIILMGFSAGGHLTACLGSFWQDDWLLKMLGADKEELRPFGQILCYPVISSSTFAHAESFRNLLGNEASEALLKKVSLEDQVHEGTPPTFLWHTQSDPTVPVENSLRYVQALQEHGIPCEFHMYPVGEHGLSTAGEFTRRSDGAKLQPECESWLSLLNIWLTSLCRNAS